MFWTAKKGPMHREIELFAKERGKYSTTPSHVQYLNEFVKVTGIESFDDVSEYDIDSYIRSVRANSSSEFRRMQAMQALYLFLQYRDVQQKNAMPRNSRGRPEKKIRNENIMELRRQEYTYGAIAKRYRLNKRTVYDIVKRLEGKG